MVYYAAAAAALLSLAASASAGSIHAHHANLHRRSLGSHSPVEKPAPYPSVVYVMPQPANKTCGCKTYTTTWYGEPTLGPSKPTSTYVPPPPPAAPTTTPESKPTYVAPVPVAPVAKPETPKAPASYGGKSGSGSGGESGSGDKSGSSDTSSSSDKSGSGKSGSGSNGVSSSISPNGNQWAMTYTPYNQDGSCKSADAVSKDVGSIKGKGFTTVRIYATDCSGLENVGAAAKQHGMKMIVGIWIDGAGLSKGHEQVSHIASWGKNNWAIVEMVVAGNEAVFSGFVGASDLAGFIGEVKTALKSAGFNGPVTTTEPLNTIQENAGIFCPVVDVIAANLHPFFNGQYSAERAGELVEKQFNDLSAVCDHKKQAYNLETGWPSHGKANGAAIPGEAEQKAAVDSIIAKVGGKSAIFSFEDDTWKAPGTLDIEQYWGCSKLFSG